MNDMSYMNDNDPLTPAQHLQAETETIERATVAVPGGSVAPAVSVDPETAGHMGAFEETALSDEEADDSRFDVDPGTGVVLDEQNKDGEPDQ